MLHQIALQDDAAAVLTAVFAYGGTVGSDRLLAVLGDSAFGALERTEVLVHDDDRVRSLVRILPYRGVWIASDDLHDDASPAMFVAEPSALGGYTAKTLERLLEAVRWSSASGSDLLAADVRPNRPRASCTSSRCPVSVMRGCGFASSAAPASSRS